jgi:hypothetical protein
MSSRFQIASIAMLLAVLVLSGCSEIRTEYGASRGSQGRKSLNGFAALRESYEQAGFHSRDVSRLSERVMRSDTIVWTPQVLAAVDTDVTRWFERWFRKGNRTLVYIVPDGGSEADYWSDTAAIAPPGQRLEYRKLAAKSVNQRMMWRLNRSGVPSNGWFAIEAFEHRKPVGRIRGRWKPDLGEAPSGETGLATELQVVEFDADKHQAGGKTNPNQIFLNTGPTGPGNAIPWTFANETKPTKTAVDFSTLLESESGEPIVVEVRSKDWKNSRIIVVVGGSLLTNYAFTRDFNRSLAGKIITETTPLGDQDLRVGFLTSNWNRIPVSEVEPTVPAITGMEILTVWPLSMVTMHGVIFGLVICLMLLPIFGRPGRVRRATHSEFGHHLDAVAALMNKTGDERYARARISEYMKRMHGETSGPWILPDPPTPHDAAPLTSKRLSSERSDVADQVSDDVLAGDVSLGTEKTENNEAEH